MTPKEVLVMLLEERTLSHFERRKRRLERIPWPVRSSALRKGWARDKHVTREEWIVLHLGWVPEEREQMIQFLESKGGYSRCRNCGRGIVSDGPHDRCAACGSARGEPGSGANADLAEVKHDER
jgi:hypothetical protein